MTKFNMMADPLLTANIRNSILRGAGEILEDSEKGIFLYDREGDVYFLYAETETGKEWLMAHEERHYEVMVLYDDAIIAFVQERYQLCGEERCKQVVWTRPEAPKWEKRLTLRAAEIEDFALIRSIYHKCSDEEIRYSIRNGVVFFGYMGDELVGMVGMHNEGSIGMLEVLPEQRRKGYGAELEKTLIARQLSLGLIPYGQVVTTNAASFAFHEAIGMECSQGTLSWIWRES